MASLNKVLLMGNCTRDVELRFTPSGTAVAQFGLAVNRKYKDKKTNQLVEEVTFLDIDTFGLEAEKASKHLSKGKAVFIDGRLKLDQWDDKQTGQKRSKIKVIAESIQCVVTEGQAQRQQPQAAAPASNEQNQSSDDTPPF